MAAEPDPAPAILAIKTLHEGFSTFSVAQVRLSDGTVVSREIEDHGDAVAVLPYDPERRTALLVRLFRPPPLYKGEPSELVEAPAGLVDPGEAPEDTARREAHEETGVRLDALDFVGRLWSTPGISTERIGLYLGACSFEGRGEGGGKAGEHEGITVLEIPLAELAGRVERGQIDDLKLLALAQALRLRKPELFG
jgi:nudix-type nucleoside diphosphatase (YffH/AdpP family)